MASRMDHRATSPRRLLSRPERSNESGKIRTSSLPWPTSTTSRTSRSRWRSFIPAVPRHYIRLRTIICLAFGIAILVVVITLNEIHLDLDPPTPSPAPLSPAAAAANKLSKPKPVAGGDEEGSNELESEPEPEIQRSFEEPDFALLSGRQPHMLGCDVPLDWHGKDGAGPEASGNEDENGVLVFLGVFSVADKRERRMLYREVYWPDFPDHLVTKRFILGVPPLPPYPTHPSAVSRMRVLRELEEENSEFNDMVILDMEDNIDFGKTHRYFQWLAKEYGGEGRVKGRPRFVMKSDDDTLLVMPNMIEAFRHIDCSQNVYWGTSSGRSKHFAEYFRGLAYAMSWPLISWVGNADMPLAHITKIEDARTGQWLRALDPVTDPIQRIDMGWTMGDWNQLDVGVETTAFHWLKLDDWVREQHQRILDLWEAAGRPYEWYNGIDPRQSIEYGKKVPSKAADEHKRQQELGWDVDGNMILHAEDV